MSAGAWPRFPDFLERFLAKCERAPGCACWTWVGCRDSEGYPNVVVPPGFPGAGKSRRMKGMRVSLILFRGVELGGRQAHHRCREVCTCGTNWKDCVNPDHAESATLLEHYRIHHPADDALAPDDFIF